MSKSKEPIEIKYAGTVTCYFCENIPARFYTTKQLDEYCCRLCWPNAMVVGLEPMPLPEMPEALRILSGVNYEL